MNLPKRGTAAMETPMDGWVTGDGVWRHLGLATVAMEPAGS